MLPNLINTLVQEVLRSSDLFEGGLEYTHTIQDIIDTVDLSQIEIAASYIRQYLTLRAVQTIS